ncbi:cell wall-binding repeat-containing protein, partial [Acinetobacter pittii]|uniref:cell wall-binding repeat-containing protein n=1 Tax=Acinetobacter pittii TaxID=48296 RepID=UPI0028131ECC
ELEDQRVTVIGGDSQISEADYAAIKDVALTLGRVSGSDRKETNAEVIRRYYANSFAGTKTVVVAKDDVLIDALTSANLAAKKNA